MNTPRPDGQPPPGPVRFDVHLVRHGQSTWNALRRAQGQAPHVPLTPLGERQAREAAQRLAGSGARTVWSSDLRRAADTARFIAQRLGARVIPDPDLRERSLGDFEGLPSAQVLAAPGTAWADPHWRPPGGENLPDVFARVQRFVRRLHRRAGGSPVVVVTHGGTAGIARAILRGRPEEAYSWLDLANGGIITVPGGPAA